MEQVKAYRDEGPADRVPATLKSADIAKLFTVETFCKTVIRQQKAAS